jgi:hypothetical protein
MIELHDTEDDAAPFLAIVQSATEGLEAAHRPELLYLIHVDNWFDHKWLGFLGGAPESAIWKKEDHLPIPPFVPNRILSQQVWSLDPTSDSRRPVTKPALHVKTGDAGKGTVAKRDVSSLAPGAVLIWYSGRTRINGRGSIMAYAPEDDGHRIWFVGLDGARGWTVLNAKGTNRESFESLCVGVESRVGNEDVPNP